MRFDFAYFAKALCMIGGILYFQDIFWFAWQGSNIDYSLPFLIGVEVAAALGSFRRKP